MWLEMWRRRREGGHCRCSRAQKEQDKRRWQKVAGEGERQGEGKVGEVKDKE